MAKCKNPSCDKHATLFNAKFCSARCRHAYVQATDRPGKRFFDIIPFSVKNEHRPFPLTWAYARLRKNRAHVRDRPSGTRKDGMLQFKISGQQLDNLDEMERALGLSSHPDVIRHCLNQVYASLVREKSVSGYPQLRDASALPPATAPHPHAQLPNAPDSPAQAPRDVFTRAAAAQKPFVTSFAMSKDQHAVLDAMQLAMGHRTRVQTIRLALDTLLRYLKRKKRLGASDSRPPAAPPTSPNGDSR